MNDERIEEIEIELSVSKEKIRILEMRINDLMLKFKIHINALDAHQI
jgi:AAA+ superfamily predicted ATPase